MLKATTLAILMALSIATAPGLDRPIPTHANPNVRACAKLVPPKAGNPGRLIFRCDWPIYY